MEVRWWETARRRRLSCDTKKRSPQRSQHMRGGGGGWPKNLAACQGPSTCCSLRSWRSNTTAQTDRQTDRQRLAVYAARRASQANWPRICKYPHRISHAHKVGIRPFAHPARGALRDEWATIVRPSRRQPPWHDGELIRICLAGSGGIKTNRATTARRIASNSTRDTHPPPANNHTCMYVADSQREHDTTVFCVHAYSVCMYMRMVISSRPRSLLLSPPTSHAGDKQDNPKQNNSRKKKKSDKENGAPPATPETPCPVCLSVCLSVIPAIPAIHHGQPTVPAVGRR
ncbi:hypothetical protein BT67DRAFT_149063 [Trichocladium antarcticum]|uniref:Uncharacterized protein n=1 Tax=Trichocladium antarcticum TaxID=1450529 RepID=A0AAN6UHF2_9PEZI|nr:hypothetical protein BT67DRAFT_149063 [Trichocladium antarcticum]